MANHRHVKDGGIGYSSIVNDAFLFFHGDTVSEAVQVSDQMPQIVEAQRDYIEQRAGGLTRPQDQQWLVDVVKAHTDSVVLPGLQLTHSDKG